MRPQISLPLTNVERVASAVEIIHLPKAPEVVLGVVNVQGRIIPVADIRKRFRLPRREIGINDNPIISQPSRRFVGIGVESERG